MANKILVSLPEKFLEDVDRVAAEEHRSRSELEIPEAYLDFIGKINTASIPTRYPDDLQRSLKEYPEPVARDYLEQTEEILQWLKQHPNLNE